MAVATISVESKLLPWLDINIVLFEFTASQATNTIDLKARGIIKFLAVLEWDTNGALLTASPATVSSLTLTVNNASTRVLAAIGR